MGRYDATWGEQEREEHEALIKEVLAVQGNSARAVAYREGIDDAIQSHRPWARDVLDKVLHDGFCSRGDPSVRMSANVRSACAA